MKKLNNINLPTDRPRARARKEGNKLFCLGMTSTVHARGSPTRAFSHKLHEKADGVSLRKARLWKIEYAPTWEEGVLAAAKERERERKKNGEEQKKRMIKGRTEADWKQSEKCQQSGRMYFELDREEKEKKTVFVPSIQTEITWESHSIVSYSITIITILVQ